MPRARVRHRHFGGVAAYPESASSRISPAPLSSDDGRSDDTEKKSRRSMIRSPGSLRDVPLFQGSASRLGYYEARCATSEDFNAFSLGFETGHCVMAIWEYPSREKKVSFRTPYHASIDRGDAYVVTMDADVAKADAGAEDASVIDSVAVDAHGRRIIGVFSIRYERRCGVCAFRRRRLDRFQRYANRGPQRIRGASLGDGCS